MRRITAVLVAGLLVVGALAALPTAAMAHAGSNAQPALDQQDGNETVTNGTTNASANATADEVAPGERLAGVLGVQAAEVEGDLRTRAFDVAFERADDNASKAEVVAREAADTSERLAELREQREALEEARRNGSMSEGEYRARTAVLATKAETVRNLADRSASASEGLPEETLRANGVNVSAIRALSADAADMSGGETAAIARSIAGGPDGSVPDRAGGPGERGEAAGNATDAGDADGAVGIERAESEVASAAERVGVARERVDSTDADENATAALDRAESRLAEAERALADARSAREAGDDDRAGELAEQAVEEAASALDEAEAAIDAAGSGADDAGTPSGSADGGSDSDGDGSTSGGSDAGGSN
jgi:hypothetical protein